ncbi:hypothetical protein EDEG_01118 [Edhazardia aedis USNM 41457]|uniref:Uncharacterized protein n=1 Tax=Edhazardia aedis (strain USNM 41457) TaxID=1003232 RepID=J9DQ43_EDHAE|nr:hypothetical protein EDEG_01118 [Edhazardia aedis USNM 41457]|eukprot:EJW04670.1 hypothetical protein EDEG_01118 [Edhazardia aedis USNM 41457]
MSEKYFYAQYSVTLLKLNKNILKFHKKRIFNNRENMFLCLNEKSSKGRLNSNRIVINILNKFLKCIWILIVFPNFFNSIIATQIQDIIDKTNEGRKIIDKYQEMKRKIHNAALDFVFLGNKSTESIKLKILVFFIPTSEKNSFINFFKNELGYCEPKEVHSEVRDNLSKTFDVCSKERAHTPGLCSLKKNIACCHNQDSSSLTTNKRKVNWDEPVSQKKFNLNDDQMNQHLKKCNFTFEENFSDFNDRKIIISQNFWNGKDFDNLSKYSMDKKNRIQAVIQENFLFENFKNITLLYFLICKNYDFKKNIIKTLEKSLALFNDKNFQLEKKFIEFACDFAGKEIFKNVKLYKNVLQMFVANILLYNDFKKKLEF